MGQLGALTGGSFSLPQAMSAQGRGHLWEHNNLELLGSEGEAGKKPENAISA